MKNEADVVLTCSNEACNCRVRIEVPCPHGDTYTCACGHPFELVFEPAGQGILT